MFDDATSRVIQRLNDTSRCPWCGIFGQTGRCSNCGLLLRGPEAARVLALSRTAVSSLIERDQALIALRAASGQAAPMRSSAENFAPTAQAPNHPRTAPPPREKKPVDVTAVLALAGAGLIAAAAMVFAAFTFADNIGLRRLGMVAVTFLMVAATPLLRRKHMYASATAVATLAGVLLYLDAWLLMDFFTALTVAGYATIALSVVTVVLFATGITLRLRPWISFSLVTAPVIPICGAFAIDANWAWPAAWLCASAIALVARLPLARIGWRIEANWRFEVQYLRVVAVGSYGAAFITAFSVPSITPVLVGSGAAIILTVAGLLACAHARGSKRGSNWYWVAGAVLTLAACAAVATEHGSVLALPVAGAALMLVLLIVATKPVAEDSRARLISGAMLVTCLVAVPACLATSGMQVWRIGTTADIAAAGESADLLRPPIEVEHSVVTGSTVVVGEMILFASIAVVVVALALILVSRLRLTTTVTRLVASADSKPEPSQPHDSDGTVAQSSGPVQVRITCSFIVVARAIAPWATLLALLTLATMPLLPAVASHIGTGILTVLLWAAVWWSRDRIAMLKRHHLTIWRVMALVGGPAVLVLGATLTWINPVSVMVGGAVAVCIAILWSRVVVGPLRSLYIAAGLGYSLFVLGWTLHLCGWSTPAMLAGVSTIASFVSIVVTLATRIDRPTWLAVLMTSLVPFMCGVVAVLWVRTLWSAAATAAMLLVELVLVSSGRRKLPTWVRAGAGALVVPTLSVLLTCLGAVLIGGSASPFVLPIIAACTAAAALCAAPITRLLNANWDSPSVAGAVRVAIEIGALVTATITLVLGIVLPASGAETTMILCSILAAGSTAYVRQTDRRHHVWAAALLWCGVLWSALRVWDVGLAEAYTAPPALVAVIVAILAMRKNDAWRTLFGAGLALLIVPSLMVSGFGISADVWRFGALTLVAVVSVIIAIILTMSESPLAKLVTVPLARAAQFSALAPALFALWTVTKTRNSDLGDWFTSATPLAIFIMVTATSLLGATVVAAGGWAVRSDVHANSARSDAAATQRGSKNTAPSLWSRMWLVPSFIVALAAPVAGASVSHASIVILLVYELALLAFLVVSVRIETRRPCSLPPAVMLWAFALVAAIAAWSSRELRVEVFALPLGLALFGVGVMAFRRGSVPWAASWPVGRTTSMQTMAIGVVATLGPSTLAIYTDPLTWRACLVIALDLAFMLFGARYLLRAPLMCAVAFLPVTIAIVFIAQMGETISTIPWLLTLAAAGGVLLTLAMFFERRKNTAPGGGSERVQLR